MQAFFISLFFSLSLLLLPSLLSFSLFLLSHCPLPHLSVYAHYIKTETSMLHIYAHIHICAYMRMHIQPYSLCSAFKTNWISCYWQLNSPLLTKTVTENHTRKGSAGKNYPSRSSCASDPALCRIVLMEFMLNADSKKSSKILFSWQVGSDVWHSYKTK